MLEAPMTGATSRLAFVDALKALASQLIVLHHLAFYGPMSDHAYSLAPTVISWLSQDARMAVQAFLVIGGFLAARGIAPFGALLSSKPLMLLLKRYLKLVAPLLVAVLIAIACAAIARTLMTHDSVPGWPTLPQVLAHALLLQGLLGYEGLSAGVWYIAIDFQLFALLVGVLWLARVLGRRDAAVAVAGALLVTTLALSSLYYFNRDGDWDNWGVYFFGAYALGIASYWATNQRRTLGWLLPMLGLVITALLLDYRPRIAVALLVALMLAFAARCGLLEYWPKSRLIAYLGQISYSVFLVHFPICLVINGLFARLASRDPSVNLTGMIIAWLASTAAGALFYRFVENPAQRGLLRARAAPVVRQTP
ncbi:MAG: acyltransferase [Candidatus Accumulibacter sp.]|nr:acyltransferase [Accumulibacter sp.]